ncbi:unnamed protein product [Sphagnum jensenii]|uniref:Uncharacterized protein n=1 Tax=Sphagnum jensenii TaxID=128206 RepID=A0ABP1BB59_9BRYO
MWSVDRSGVERGQVVEQSSGWVVVQSVKLGHGAVDELGRGAMVRQSRVLEQAWGNYSRVKSAHTHTRSQLLGLHAFFPLFDPLGKLNQLKTT